MPVFRREITELAAGKSARRLTVVRSGALGDTILLLPLLALLREALPGADLTLVGSWWAEQLLPLMASPPGFVRFDSAAMTPLFSVGAACDAVGVFEGADLVLVYTSDGSGALVRNARRFCKGSVLCWPAMPGGVAHAACHLAAAALSGVPGLQEIPLPSLHVPSGAVEWARGWLARETARDACPPVAVHPGSGGSRKCWPAARFASVIERLQRAGRQVLVMEGPADREICDEVCRGRRSWRSVYRPGPLSLARCAALIACCRVYVGNDSGLTHLAAALGMPVVAIFGPTDAAIWAPLGETVKVLGGSACRGAGGGFWPGQEEVLRAVARFLGDEPPRAGQTGATASAAQRR